MQADSLPPEPPRKPHVDYLPASSGDADSIRGPGRPLEKEMATHSSILSWEILWTEQPGTLQES